MRLLTVRKLIQGLLLLHFLGLFSFLTHFSNWVEMWQGYYSATKDSALSFSMVMDPSLSCQLCQDTTSQEQSPVELNNVFKKDILFSELLCELLIWNNPHQWELPSSKIGIEINTSPRVPPPEFSI